MINFIEWLKLEQPHLTVSDKPITFKVGGEVYKDIIFVDPRIEMLPEDVKFNFFKKIIGNKEMPPKNIYFIDDHHAVFEITPSGKISQSNDTPQSDDILPQYWWKNAQFIDVNDNYIDNLNNNNIAATG